ncbi:MAG: RagB/SusD family nutrient uptake outer membrane protein, partial [Cyclobacteriaceae bacterium]
TLLITLFSQACSDDFLDLPPVDTSNTSPFYKTASDLESAIISVYSAWKGATVWLPTKTEFRSDNLTADRLYGLKISTNTMGPATTSGEWDRIFKDMIFRSNVVLENVDNIRDTVPELADKIRGEALFFRGYAYYWGALYFGGLPLITETLSIEVAPNIPRSTEAETWQQAEQDLEEAVSLLPVSVSQFGRVDKHAAAAFLARVYLQQRKWAEAIPVLEDIRSNSGHTLETVWTDMWSKEAEKTSNEYMLTSIWSEVDFNRE